MPVLAHPERCAEVTTHPDRLMAFTERGWLLAVNALSLDGRHGADAQRTVWRLLDSGAGDLVASDAHSDSRPPELDWAYELLSNRYGVDRTRPLFDGSALERRIGHAAAA